MSRRVSKDNDIDHTKEFFTVTAKIVLLMYCQNSAVSRLDDAYIKLYRSYLVKVNELC